MVEAFGDVIRVPNQQVFLVNLEIRLYQLLGMPVPWDERGEPPPKTE